jgi:hypothetical protein
MNEDIKHYYLNVVNGIVTNIDLIYSPDEDGYYLEKFVYDQTKDDLGNTTFSEIYKNKFGLLTDFKRGNLKFE